MNAQALEKAHWLRVYDPYTAERRRDAPDGPAEGGRRPRRRRRDRRRGAAAPPKVWSWGKPEGEEGGSQDSSTSSTDASSAAGRDAGADARGLKAPELESAGVRAGVPSEHSGDTLGTQTVVSNLNATIPDIPVGGVGSDADVNSTAAREGGTRTPEARTVMPEVGSAEPEGRGDGPDSQFETVDLSSDQESEPASPSQGQGQTQVTENPGQAEVTEDPGQAEVTGDPGQAEVTGDPGQAEVTGDPGQAEVTEDKSLRDKGAMEAAINIDIPVSTADAEGNPSDRPVGKSGWVSKMVRKLFWWREPSEDQAEGVSTERVSEKPEGTEQAREASGGWQTVETSAVEGSSSDSRTAGIQKSGDPEGGNTPDLRSQPGVAAEGKLETVSGAVLGESPEADGVDVNMEEQEAHVEEVHVEAPDADAGETHSVRAGVPDDGAITAYEDVAKFAPRRDGYGAPSDVGCGASKVIGTNSLEVLQTGSSKDLRAVSADVEIEASENVSDIASHDVTTGSTEDVERSASKDGVMYGPWSVDPGVMEVSSPEAKLVIGSHELEEPERQGTVKDVPVTAESDPLRRERGPVVDLGLEEIKCEDAKLTAETCPTETGETLRREDEEERLSSQDHVVGPGHQEKTYEESALTVDEPSLMAAGNTLKRQEEEQRLLLEDPVLGRLAGVTSAMELGSVEVTGLRHEDDASEERGVVAAELNDGAATAGSISAHDPRDAVNTMALGASDDSSDKVNVAEELDSVAGQSDVVVPTKLTEVNETSTTDVHTERRDRGSAPARIFTAPSGVATPNAYNGSSAAGCVGVDPDWTGIPDSIHVVDHVHLPVVDACSVTLQEEPLVMDSGSIVRWEEDVVQGPGLTRPTSGAEGSCVQPSDSVPAGGENADVSGRVATATGNPTREVTSQAEVAAGVSESSANHDEKGPLAETLTLLPSNMGVDRSEARASRETALPGNSGLSDATSKFNDVTQMAAPKSQDATSNLTDDAAQDVAWDMATQPAPLSEASAGELDQLPGYRDAGLVFRGGKACATYEHEFLSKKQTVVVQRRRPVSTGEVRQCSPAILPVM